MVGAAGSGKSATAAAVAAAAENRGRRALLVSPPSGAADAGVLAVAGVARRLGEPGAARLGWDQLRHHTSALLHDHAQDVVLVCDEPSRWGAAGGLFARRAEEAGEALFGLRTEWPVVVCDQRDEPLAIRIPPATPELLLAGDWGLLADAAGALARLPVSQVLKTPLELRLATALLAWGAAPADSGAHRLGLALAQTVAARRHGKALWAMWQRLGLARIELDDEGLIQLGADRLTPLADATLRLALLDGVGRLHEVLRAVPDERAPDPALAAHQKRDAHERLFRYHYGRFEQSVAEGVPSAADDAAEAMFHAGELGDDVSLNLIGVELVEQLDALGHRLGSIHKDHEAAATVFRRAIEMAPDDSYALHHRGYHLDAQGENPDEVQRSYARALDLDPNHPEWHARYIAFLAHAARLSNARSAWSSAESNLVDSRDNGDLYSELHLPVAAALLAVGELAFCYYVLDGVPGFARGPVYRQLSSILDGRLAGEDEAAFVPAPRSGTQWWREGPERLPARDTEGRPLIAWLAGRIEAVEPGEITVHVARVDAETGPYGAGLMRLSEDDLAARMLDHFTPDALRVGQFIEIGRYREPATEARSAIVVLRPEPIGLPVDILSPERWLREDVRGTAVD